MSYDEKVRTVRATITNENVTGIFEAEKYENSPLLDTLCSIRIDDFSITWQDSNKMMEELVYVIKKYRI